MRYAFSVADEGDHLEVLSLLAEALVQRNALYMRRNPALPSIGRSGVVYEQESPDGPDDDWRDIPTLYALGRGDCDDIACAHAGQLRARGIAASAHISHARIEGGLNLYHVRVRFPNGAIEDPSQLLGME